MAVSIVMPGRRTNIWAFRRGWTSRPRSWSSTMRPNCCERPCHHRGWKPQVLGLSGVTDAYQPIERQLGLTRRCLAVLAEYRQAVTIITKNRLVTRDIDLLAELAQDHAAGVFVSITSLDDELIGRLEPRTTRPRGRLDHDRRAGGRRHPDRRDGGAGDSRADRARNPVDLQGGSASRGSVGGLHARPAAAGGRRPF